MSGYPTPRDKIMALALQDATVYHCIKMSDMQGEDWLTTVEKIVLMLAAEKERLLAENKRVVEGNTSETYLLPGGLYDKNRRSDAS